MNWLAVTVVAAALCTVAVVNAAAAAPQKGNGNGTDSKTAATGATGTKDGKSREMLALANSTTALICEPIFNENDPQKSATWYKDGRPVATVTGHSNAILGNRSVKLGGPIPQVGFLIVANIRLEDEGEYWCVRDDAARQGEHSRLRVAFLTPLANASRRLPYAIDRDPTTGVMSLVLTCPETRGLPKPTISWFYNDEPLNFFGGRYDVAGSRLTVRRFDARDDAGAYECALANFAGRTSARVDVPPVAGGDSPQPRPRARTSGAVLCGPGYFRNEILWFLIGCLSTSCVVLLYLIAGTIFFKCSKRGRRQRYHNAWPQNLDANGGGGDEAAPSGRLAARLRHWLAASTDANRLPGFRKVVAPAPPAPRRSNRGENDPGLEDGAPILPPEPPSAPNLLGPPKVVGTWTDGIENDDNIYRSVLTVP